MEVTQDFSSGLNFIRLELVTRMMYFRKLPWSLAGLAIATVNPLRAQDHARRILHEFSQSPKRPELHHRLTWMLLVDDPHISQQLRLLADGRDMFEMQEMCELTAEMSLIPLSERRQEGAHSLVAMATHRRRPLIANMSLTVRMREISWFIRHERWHEVLLGYFSSAVSVDWIASTFRHDGHALWQEAKRSAKEDGIRSNLDSLIDTLFYGASAEDRFQSQKAAVTRHKAKQQKRAAMIRQLRQLVSPKDKHLHGMRLHALQDHLQRFLRFYDVMYSVPVAAHVFCGLDEALGNPLRQRRQAIANDHDSDDADKFTMESDVHVALQPERPVIHSGGLSRRRIFFKVVSLRPSVGRHIKPGAGTTASLQHGDIATTLHQVVCTEIDSSDAKTQTTWIHCAVASQASSCLHSVMQSMTCCLPVIRILSRLFLACASHSACAVADTSRTTSWHRFASYRGCSGTTIRRGIVCACHETGVVLPCPRGACRGNGEQCVARAVEHRGLGRKWKGILGVAR